MRAFKRTSMRGFTLVELMIVVAIIGVLAALAIYGVTRYLASAKTSEAKNTIGAISRGAQAAYEREQNAAELLSEGASGAVFTHDLCGGSTFSTGNGIPLGRKDQPNSTTFTAPAAGVNTPNIGWLCLRFSISDPVYYRYGYRASTLGSTFSVAGPATPTGLSSVATGSFLAFAEGDLNANSVNSAFGIQGAVNVTTSTIRVDTQTQIVNELE